jgi:hypothetical protein
MIDNLVDLKTKYNIVENVLDDINNQLQVHFFKIINHKQAM